MAYKLSELSDRTDPFYMDDKRAASQDEFVLERVQGLTTTTLHSLDSNPVTGWVAFPAACVLVLLDPKTNEQKFIESPSLRNISCCAFSDDGRFVAFGEAGMKPHIAMWNLREHKESHRFVADTTLRAIFFHPTSQIMISLAMKETFITVWDYVKGMRMASCKWQTLPLALTIPRIGSSLIVCGHRKITHFNIAKVESRSHETNVFEDRKTVLLGKQSEYTFVDIVSGRGKHDRTVFTVTSCGYLCEVKLGDILIDKAIKVDVQIFCVRYSTELLFVGCPAGVVKICDPDNLTVTAAVSLNSLLGPSAMPKVGSKGHIDVCTLVVDENEKIVTCVYADCSMHSWQIGTDGQKIVCSAIEPGSGGEGVSGHPASKSNLLRAFIGCCEKSKSGTEFLSKFSMTDQTKPPQQFGGRRLVNENRVCYQNVNAVRFSPDGKDVICGNEEGEIKVYELSTGILRRVIEAHSSQVTCIELMYDDDFQLVCSGGRDRVMFVLNARTDFSLVQVLCDHSAAITAISLVNHKGVLTLVSAAADNVILIRRAILGGTLRFTITGELAQTNCNRSFFVTSDYIALGGKDSQIKVFKADPVFMNKPLKTINCQKLSPTGAGFKAIDIDPSSSFMAVSQVNGNISVYHLQTGQPVASLPLQSDIINIRFTPDLKYMVSSTSNGCDLVWRLPERMTDFMRSKQEKTYQIETNKEVTYEATYMSCVKVCKGGDEDDEDSSDPGNQKTNSPEQKEKRVQRHHHGSQDNGYLMHEQRKAAGDIHHPHVAQNSSNHNSEWDHTPSIESMSVLDHYSSQILKGGNEGHGAWRRDATDGKEGGGHGDKSRGCSTCESNSNLSCSTCTQSVSTTTHTSCCSAVASDSSQAAEGEARRNLRFYCGADHELFGQVVEQGHCIKLGPFREGSQAGVKLPRDLPGDDNKAELNVRKSPLTEAVYKSTDTETVVSPNRTPETQDVTDRTTETAGVEESHTNGGQRGDEQRNDGLTTGTKVDIQVSRNTKKNGGVVANRSVTKDTSSEYSENIDFSRETMANLCPNFPQNVSQNSDKTLLMPKVPRFSQSKKILEKTMFYEGVMKGDLKSSRRAVTSSPTRQDTAAVQEAVRILSQRRPGKTVDSKSLQQAPATGGNSGGGGDKAAADETEEEEGEEVDGLPAYQWTPLTTPEYSNTSSNITNLVPASSSTVVDSCNYNKLLQDAEAPVKVETSLERLARDRRCSPTPCISEDPTLINTEVREALEQLAATQPQSDTTQEDGESLHTEFNEEPVAVMPDSNLEQVSGAVDLALDDFDLLKNGAVTHDKRSEQNEQLASEIEPLHTSPLESDERTSLEGVKLDVPQCVVDDTSSLLVSNEIKVKDTYPKSEVEPGAEACVSRNGDDDKKPYVVTQLEEEGIIVPEKYHSALRSCMQLSNSQETFATLRVDTNDLELMAFLSHALKRKLVAAGLVGLSYNEIDQLLERGVTSDSSCVSETDSRDTGTESDEVAACLSKVDTSTVVSPVDKYLVPQRVLTTKMEADEEVRLVREPKRNGSPMTREEIASAGERDVTDKGYGESLVGRNTTPMMEEPKLQRVIDALLAPTKSPASEGGEPKRQRMSKFFNRLSSARRRITNRSANHSSTESKLLEDHIPQLRHRDGGNDLTFSDTYLRLDVSSEESPTQGRRKLPTKNALAPAADGPRAIDTECGKSLSGREFSAWSWTDNPSLSSASGSDLQATSSLAEYGSSFYRCKASWGLEESSAPGRRTRAQARSVPAPSDSASKAFRLPTARSGGASPARSPFRDQCLSEGCDLKKLHTGRARWREGRIPHPQISRKSTASSGGKRGSEGSIYSNTDSLDSTISKESDSGVEASSHRENAKRPMADIFRDQDEYLRRLKEVRENFERSIQALSAERKSRQAAEERSLVGMVRK